MAKYQDTIEINGKLYNLKGEVKPISVPQKNNSTQINRVVDGFVAPKPQSTIKPVTPDKPKVITKPAKIRTVGINVAHRTQQRSNILMRKSVKKPTTHEKPKEIQSLKTKHNIRTTSAHLSKINRSPFISKFNKNNNKTHTRIKPIAVALPPVKNKPKADFSPSPNKQIKNQYSPIPSPSNSEKLFTDALMKSNNISKNKSKPHKNKNVLKWGSLSVLIIFLTGVFVYLNLPLIQFKVAGMQAGFAASIPNYKPDGYSIKGPVSFESGKVTIGFKSNTDDRAYTIKQEVSNWNSQSLIANFLTNSNKKFTTEQDSGKTIYMYDNGSATWVNGGIWYQVISNSLNSEQLLEIASSM